MHEGHRNRMLDRATAGDLQDHELLEILLFNPIPRKNTNEIAHGLLARFGSLKNVLAADEAELMRVEGVGKRTAQYLVSIKELVSRVVVSETRPTALSFGNISSFVRERFVGLGEEVMDIFCLDKTDKIKHTARFETGETLRVSLNMDEVERVLIAHSPYSVVAAHNHPKNTCHPSVQDDLFTAQLQLLCSLNKVKLRDHIIVGADGMFSYFAHGRMEEIENMYSVENIIKHIP